MAIDTRAFGDRGLRVPLAEAKLSVALCTWRDRQQVSSTGGGVSRWLFLDYGLVARKQWRVPRATLRLERATASD